MSPFAAHPTALRPWQPMTDAEWEAIRRFLPPHEGRGRPSDKRKTMYAVFWIACSREPWRALPSHLGNGESVARTLRRWARAGWLDRLLVAVSDHPLGGGCDVLRTMTWLICRAFRRMARIVGENSVKLAERLGLRDAWPVRILRWPDWDMIHTASAIFRGAGETAVSKPLCRKKIGYGLKVYRHCIAIIRYAAGNQHQWSLR